LGGAAAPKDYVDQQIYKMFFVGMLAFYFQLIFIFQNFARAN